MDPITFPESLSELSAEDLAALGVAARTALAELLAVEHPTVAQADEAERVWTGLQAVDAESSARTAAPDRLAAVRAAFAEPPPQPEPTDPVGPPQPGEPDEVEPPEPEPADEPAKQTAQLVPAAQAAQTTVVTLNNGAVEGTRPAPVALVARDTVIRAAAGVPSFNTGETMSPQQLAAALLDKFEHFPQPSGLSKEFGTELHTYALAAIDRSLGAELTITEAMGYEEREKVLDYATNEKRLPGQSLVAAGGWCAPSTTDYNLADDGSTTDGLLNLPTVNLPRGGIRFTLGPDFSDIYALTNFYKMTEAQAIAGSFTKPCFTVTCPTFTDHRMDAYGYCFQVPFLTEVGYPEVIRRYLSGSMTAYAHKIDIEKINQLIALFPAAEAAADRSGTAASLAAALQLIIDRERAKRKWALNQAVEVLLPSWVLGAIKLDIGLRTGRDNANAVSDAEVGAVFSQANANPTWLVNFQPLGATALAYPATFDMLIYRAGTFVVGQTSVVNLSSVYDAASLATNVYTAAFFEEGMTVMRRGFGGVRITVKVCNAGRTGINDVTCP